MSQKKMVNRNVAIALGIVSLVLIAGLSVVLYMSYSPTSGSSVASLQNQNTQLQTWLSGNETLLTQTETWLQGNISALNSLQSTYNNYVSGHHHTDTDYQNLQTQIANLQSQIATLQAPNLIQVNLKSDDNHPFLASEYLHVYGEICNVGSNTAYNCKLHVVGYQSGGVTAFDTYIVIGTISGISWTSVDGQITYNGGALTSWSIAPQWTSS